MALRRARALADLTQRALVQQSQAEVVWTDLARRTAGSAVLDG